MIEQYSELDKLERYLTDRLKKLKGEYHLLSLEISKCSEALNYVRKINIKDSEE